jgi:pimeloyl-ACP methyl ester carboxylesterase
MNASRQLALIAALFLQLLPAFADDVITNIMSPIASYQYPDNFSSESLTNGGVISPFVSYQYLENFSTAALSNGGIMSPLVSYQYYEWPGSGILNLQYSPTVSYYYPFLDTPPLTIIPTNRTPTSAEITPLLAALPTTSQLMAFHGGIFTPNLNSVDPNQATIVLTHGWNDNPNTWPSNMAALFRANGVSSPNIVAWDWSLVASSPIDAPGIPEQQTGDQGRALGQALLLKLGANYSKPIQFIGHSLGTLVNASAANYLHGDRWAQENVSPTPWLGSNTLMTLFDEAEAARGNSSFAADIDTLQGKNGNPLASPSKATDHPLPKQSAWAENYIAAFGLLQTNAANVILTNEFPANANNPVSWFEEIAAFHHYPIDWYGKTIQTDNSAMGFVWPLLWSVGDAAFANAPTNGSVYVQAFNASQWDLTVANWNYGTNLLAARFQAYRNGLFYSLTGETLDQAAVNGNGNGQNLVGALAGWQSFVFSIFTTPANTSSPAPQIKVHPLGLTANDASSSNTNIPAYAWMPLVVPANAVSLSFDYTIQGDWQSDSLAAAFNGTNVLALPGSQIETNILFSSGSIDVSAFAGQTNEFFIGIVGGTSTNAQLTVENFAFSVSSPPSLQAQTSVGGLMLSWPLSAANFSLQTTTNLADPNSWVTLTNVSAIVNLQNTITNSIIGSQGFYRLIQSQ